MATVVQRDVFKSFWSKFSDLCDNRAMMLNQNADELECYDRADILACLPSLHGKDAVDVGAGIGRFTTLLAESARYVLSTDFIESFIQKNQERNAHLGNIEYRLGDAVNLELEPASVDLVFTNWLMMYMSDSEMIMFLSNALRWLRPHGYVHLRESCSEPSTARTGNATLHCTTDTNPTSYRYSSAYIALLRNIRHRDEDGQVWCFDVLWSCSVPTYIKRQNNWRQVHWLTKKVPAADNLMPAPHTLRHKLGCEWKKEQIRLDALLDREKYVWTDKIIAEALTATDLHKNSTLFTYNPRQLAFHVHINAHLIAEKFTCNVWNVETNEFYYRTSLTKANKLKDQRVRFGWNQNLNSALEYWRDRGAQFDGFVATELLSTVGLETIRHIVDILRPEATVILLEPIRDDNHSIVEATKMLSPLRDVKVEELTEKCTSAMASYMKDMETDDKLPTKRWILVTARA